MKTLLFILVLFVFSCNDHQSAFPGNFRSAPNPFHYKLGDLFVIKHGDKYLGALLSDLAFEDSMHWYGFTFTDYYSLEVPKEGILEENRFFGRKIQSSLKAEGFEIGLDITAVNDTFLIYNSDKVKKVGHLLFNFNKVVLGAIGSAGTYGQFLEQWQYGKERRLLPPDDYRDHIIKLDKFRPEEYFFIRDFLK